MRHLWVLGALALLAGCDQPKPRHTAEAPPPAAAPAAAPATPAWAAALDGQALATAFPAQMQCQSYVDGPVERNPSAVKVLGWSWRADKGAGVEHVVMTDAGGKMVAFGDGGGARPDVPANVKTITRPDVGWSVAVPASMTGTLTVYGVDLAGKASCRLGEAKL
jgi:hypothetical protein